MTYTNNFTILCTLHGSVFPRVFCQSLVFAAIGGLALVLYRMANKDMKDNNETHSWYEQHFTTESDLHVYMGFVVSLMLAFRTNSCFGRYDAGVAVSGKMRTHARTLVSQAAAYIGGGVAEDSEPAQRECATQHVRDIRRLTVLFCLLFKRHLHTQDAKPLQSGVLIYDEELTILTGCDNGAERVVTCVYWLRRQFARARRDGLLGPTELKMLDEEVVEMLANFQTGCRLAFVPMPFPYAQMVKFVLVRSPGCVLLRAARISAGSWVPVCLLAVHAPTLGGPQVVYLVVAPFAFVDRLKEATPVGAWLLSMLFLAIEEIGCEIEDPCVLCTRH